jgi:hypothetical protein
MNENGKPVKAGVVTIPLGDTEGKIEKLLLKGTPPEKIRISCWGKDQTRSLPLDLTEEELVDLLYQAIRAGILSPEFLNKLHSEFEI